MDAAWDAASGAASGAILALVAYDYAGDYMQLSTEALRAIYALDKDPAAYLLMPLSIAMKGTDV